MLFSPDTVNPQHATFLNVTFGSSFDADDTHVGAMLHPGVAAWSAALAVAEHTGASGPEVLAAVVAGYETIDPHRHLRCSPSHFKRGFQSTGTCDGFGTAAAAGRLLFRGTGARAQDRRRARACRRLRQRRWRSSTIPADRPSASTPRTPREGGVAAALLAAEGYSGPNDIIEGQGGFARAYADGFKPELIEEGLGQRFHLMDVLVKSHAAAARVAAGIDAMLELREQYKFASGDIASMALGIPKIIQGRLTNPHPVDLQAAQMCLPFSVALASKIMLAAGQHRDAGHCGLRGRARDQSLHALEERTTIALDDEVEAASNELSTAARVSVTLRDGRTLSRFVPAPKGSPSQPFTGEEHEARFTQELSSRVSERSAPTSSRCRAISIGSIRPGSVGCWRASRRTA